VQNELRLTIDLTKDEEYLINGSKGELRVRTKNKAVCICESCCPHQDCVKMGYVDTSNHPIICAYNATYVIIEDTADYDLEI